MEFINYFKEKRKKWYDEQKQAIQHQSEEVITITDFADSLYIAYNGVPIILIDENLSSKMIVKELAKVRQNYINSRTR